MPPVGCAMGSESKAAASASAARMSGCWTRICRRTAGTSVILPAATSASTTARRAPMVKNWSDDHSSRTRSPRPAAQLASNSLALPPPRSAEASKLTYFPLARYPGCWILVISFRMDAKRKTINPAQKSAASKSSLPSSCTASISSVPIITKTWATSALVRCPCAAMAIVRDSTAAITSEEVVVVLSFVESRQREKRGYLPPKLVTSLR
mmetsp:Transcript_76593/g.203399  ORF Transcript_76593/g.203399 Transcript_76593/m.203399 type:complete len:209 (+) Transcript_76593:281-907(+)